MEKKMTSKQRSMAAKKANRTRKAFATLMDQYGYYTMRVVKASRLGHKDELRSLRSAIGIGTVAAILANDTRGTYDHILG
jgi:hypothetical protein